MAVKLPCCTCCRVVPEFNNTPLEDDVGEGVVLGDAVVGEGVVTVGEVVGVASASPTNATLKEPALCPWNVIVAPLKNPHTCTTSPAINVACVCVDPMPTTAGARSSWYPSFVDIVDVAWNHTASATPVAPVSPFTSRK